MMDVFSNLKIVLQSLKACFVFAEVVFVSHMICSASSKVTCGHCRYVSMLYRCLRFDDVQVSEFTKGVFEDKLNIYL